MKVVLLSVGKTDEDFYVRAIEMFKKRLSHYIPFELDFVPDVKNRKNLSEKEQKQLEGEAILNRIQPGDHVVLLDDKGKQY
jgi:23S rRNA (pseudouridine1915-N3)-methyltransferase